MDSTGSHRQPRPLGVEGVCVFSTFVVFNCIFLHWRNSISRIWAPPKASCQGFWRPGSSTSCTPELEAIGEQLQSPANMFSACPAPVSGRTVELLASKGPEGLPKGGA